jgi:hypothetical protein
MSAQNYSDLIAHQGHKLSISTYSGENVAIECEECFEVLLDYDREGENE